VLTAEYQGNHTRTGSNFRLLMFSQRSTVTAETSSIARFFWHPRIRGAFPSKALISVRGFEIEVPYYARSVHLLQLIWVNAQFTAPRASP
jgi:hypothetical protein